jgi:hypothetical protein
MLLLSDFFLYQLLLDGNIVVPNSILSDTYYFIVQIRKVINKKSVIVEF